jgi:DHA1 family bicyclomycin/chloramphenicol resistance-like MFS transporter
VSVAPVLAPSRRRMTLILGALSTFGPLSMDMYLPGLPALSRDLHASASLSQLTLTACMLGIAVGQLVAGPISDAHGRRRPVIAGVAGYTAASVACAFAPSIGVLIALRFAQGFVGGFGIVIARAIVRDLYEGVIAARMFAALMIVTGVAPVLAPLIGGQVLTFTSWRGVFVVLGGIGVPLLLMSIRWLGETLPESGRHSGGLVQTLGTFRGLIRARSFAPYAVSFSLSFAAMFAYIAGSSFVLEDVFHTSPQVFSLVFAVNSVGLTVAAQLGSRLLGAHSPERLLRLGLAVVALAGVGALVVTLTHAGLWPLLVCLFALLTGNGLVLPNGVAAALAGRADGLGSASALLGVGQFGAGAVIAPLVGAAGTHNALPMAIAIAACGVTALSVNLALSPG